MALLKRWDPFKEFLEKFFSEEEFLPLPVFRFSSYPVDVYETEKEVVVNMEVPGFTKEDLKINFEDDYLVVEGKKTETEEKEEKNYWRKERRQASFRRIIPLLAEVDYEKAKARLKDGVLEIVLPKLKKEETQKGKEIKID